MNSLMAWLNSTETATPLQALAVLAIWIGLATANFAILFCWIGTGADDGASGENANTNEH